MSFSFETQVLADDSAVERARMYVGKWVEGFSRRAEIEHITAAIVKHAVAHYPEPSDALITIRMDRAHAWETRVTVEETRGPTANPSRAVERMGGMNYNPLTVLDTTADFWEVETSSTGFRRIWFDMIDNDPCCKYMSGGTWEEWGPWRPGGGPPPGVTSSDVCG